MWSLLPSFLISNYQKSKIISKAIKDNNVNKIKYYVHSRNINDKWSQDAGFLELAVKYGSLEVMEYLLDQGASCSLPTHDGDTILLSAIRAGNEEMVKLMLQYPQVIETINRHSGSKGDTALSYSFMEGNEKMIELLVSTQEVNIQKEYNAALVNLIGRIKSLEYLKYIAEDQMKAQASDLLLEMQNGFDVDGLVLDIIGSDFCKNALDAA
ncbi:hypothetical protein phytr_6750 [Candidatus Phycorickettsia trachydisci]|uniref:Uncharacterized protein n=1 Tax=Candidatus Phycorickettsia trachydisci TaxID=2115978 RepID=A0A2P1P8N7_9RICK|nr:ankyrin repeat domain-containing protein [Candidatus Phycorickettsia trachydisci]AVP87616.1 hypothetical protein phytr_6750 [Candidatus Phycorickettsia trachydisci]